MDHASTNTLGNTMKFIKMLGIVFDRALDAAAFLSGVSLLFLTLLVCVAVVFRYFFHSPFGWSTEISQYTFVLMGNLVIGWVLRREKHVKVDVFINSFDKRKQAIVNTITSAVSTMTCFIITIFAVRVTWDLYRSDYFEPTILMIPKFIFILVIAFGCFMLSVQFTRRTYAYLMTWRSRP